MKKRTIALFLTIFFLGGMLGLSQETAWHPGSVFGKEKRFVSHDIVEYEQGKIWVVCGLASDGKLYYFTRISESDGIVESPAKLISDQIFPSGTTSKVFISEKDGFFQFSVSTEIGIRCFWIKPEELFFQPSPPPEEYPDPIPIMGFQGVGGFHYYKITKNKYETRKLLQEIKNHGYYLNDAFMFLSDNRPEHANLTYHTPWRWDGKLFHLNEWNPIFWEDFKAYLEMHKEVGLDFCAQLWMRKDYINYPYKNNVNGIKDFWDKDAMLIHRAYARKVMETYRAVYGRDYKAYIKVSPNEVAHHGGGEKFHQIMYFCEDIFEGVLDEYTDISHIVCDLTGCEGTIGELREPHNCPKLASCDRDGRHGKAEYDRLAVGEKHKYSTWADFAEINRYFNSANKRRRFTEDGGGRSEDGTHVVRSNIKLGSPAQQGQMMGELAKLYKKTGKQAIFCSFPHDALKIIDGVFYPDYRVSQMSHVFACAKEMQKEYWKVMK